MLEGCSIICFGPSDWWGMNPSCATHIMKKLAAKNKVLYVNPFSSDLGNASRKGLGARISRKAKSLMKYLKQPQSNLFVFSPIFLPFQGNQLIDIINNHILKWQIKAICKRIGISQPLVWIENVRVADFLNWIKPYFTVYHVSDLFSKSAYSSDLNNLQRRELKVSNDSNLLICVSRKLYELKSSQRENVHYLPHGVNFHLFNKAAKQKIDMEELADIPRPIAGYFGTMTAENDIELVRYCASNLTDVSFVFAGQITTGDYSELLLLPNVFHLGKLPYERIPHLCAGFDVCLLQWKMTEWIKYCNPLKLFEYMASGCPVVSVPIAEVVDHYSDVVSVAYDSQQFCRAIEWELHHDTAERKERRIRIAEKYSWNENVEKISHWIIDAITEKSRQPKYDHLIERTKR